VALAVLRLRLTGFRCYAHAQLDLDARPVVLTGPNGAGKTNLLEAISLLAPGRGLRGARLEEMDRRDPPRSETAGDGSGEGWTVAASLATPAGVVEIGTGHRPETVNRRIVQIDGKQSRSQTNLSDHVSAIWLTPAMDRLFAEGASGRRRFLDRLVFGFDAAHAGRVSAYEHTLRERARLLRDGGDAVWLDTLEGDMAERGVAIAAARRELTARLCRLCAAPDGPFPGAEIAVTGHVEEWLDQGPALAAEDRLRAALRDSRPQDAAAGGAAVGPHRSDLAVRHLAHGMPAALCSTGEQKALLIAIVLANARLQTAERGSVPLLLLDEVAAHLDAVRREALFGELLSLGAQAWFTGTDRSVFDFLGSRAQFVVVRAGQLERDGRCQPAAISRRPARSDSQRTPSAPSAMMGRDAF
jgi:DNA replication and repair protein RecF